jgi:class 3 adenylate cyclase/tetratricopeptide (TPR) repeat protein
MGCGASSGGVKYQGAEEPVENSAKEAAEGQPAASAVLGQAESALDGDMELKPEREAEACLLFERRAGWVAMKVAPPSRKLKPEWVARWLVQVDGSLRVFTSQPGLQPAHARRSKRGGQPQPVQSLALSGIVVEKIPRSKLPEGRASSLLLRTRKEEELEQDARAAAIDDAFTVPTRASQAAAKAKKKKPAKNTPKPPTRKVAGRGKKASRGKGEGGGGTRASKSKSTKKSDELGDAGKRSKSSAKARKGRQNAEGPGSTKDPSKETAAVQLTVDLGTGTELLWWCRALFEGGAQVPSDIEAKLWQIYREEQHERVLAARRVWRQRLVRMSRYIPRCVLQCHTQEDKIAPVDEPRMEIFDAAVAQIRLPGVTRVVERFSTKHDAGMRKLQALHASLFAIVLGCIDQHGGDVVSLGGDAVVAMWGRARGWGRQDADKLKRDVIRACQCMERLRAVVDGAAAQNVALQGTKFSVRVSITAGRICGVWAGGFHERRQFLLKGSPIVRLRHAAALAMDGDIILAPDAHELCEEGSWLVTRAVDAGHATSADDSGAQQDSDVYLAMEKMVPGADGAGATPTIPAAPLSSFTSHPKMTEDIAKLQTKRAELQSDLGRLQLEETPEISEDNLHALTQFDSVMKAIIKLRSILKEEFLDNLLAFLKAQGQADFNLISKYEKARRIMLELLTDETMDEFRSAHWDKWDVWKDAVQESLELDRRQKILDKSSEVQPEAEPDGDAESNDADTESFIVEPSKRQIFDHGTKEILLHGTLQAIADIDEAMKLQDYEHEQWQRPVMDVILEYIPDNAQEFVEGHAEHKLKQVSVVCVQLPEQNFDQEDEELRRTAMTELQHIVLCMQQLADKFRADLRELVTNRNATILALILEQTSHAHHAKVALAVALGVRDCFTQMNMESAIAVTAGQVYDTLVGDNDGTRCQLACMGAVVDSAIGLLHSATLLPAEFGGIVCDEVVRNGALTSQAALSSNPATAVWTMDLVFDALGRISVDGRRLRAYAPRRFEEWAGGYLLRCRCAPFYPELSIGVIGRHSEVLQLRDWFARSGNRRALVRGCQGSGKTALAAAFYDDLYHHGYICLAGRALQVRQNTPYHVWNEVVEALLVFACKSTQLPVLHSTDAQALENSLQPANTHRASSEPPSTSMKMGASKCSEITPWWLNGTECGDATALLDAAVESLPDDLRSIHPVVDMMLPNVEVSETPATKELDGKVRASTTSTFVLDLITLVLRRTGRRLCIMMDDVQWLDHSSAALVRYILKKLPEVTWYFNVDDASIADSRFCTALCRSPDTLALALGELAPEHTLVLAEQQCAQMDAPMLEPATRDFFLTLPGIPLHTIHFTLSLFETDDIIPYKGCARAGPRLIEPDQRTLYPSDIGAIIRTRLENLEEDLRPLVLLPSVLDNTRAFTPTSAVRLAQIYKGFDPTTPHVTTLAQIERLCTMKLLAWSEKWTQQLAFSSKLVRDIAYEKLPPRQRCSLHENMAVHLNTKHLASKENVRDILDSVYEKCEDPFCTSRDVKYIQEHSFDLGKIDTKHRAWTNHIPQDHSKLAGKPIHMPGHGFGIVKNLNGNKLTGFSVQAIFDNGATEKLSLDTNGSGLLSFKYFDIEDMAAAAETAIRRAQTRYHECRDHSAYFHYEADEQLLLLDAMDDKAVTLLQGCVENLYCSVKQMARAGALVEAAQSVSKTLTLFDQLPDKDTIPRQTQELELLSIFHRNWLAEDVSELYRGVRPPHIARMRTVANKLGATDHVFPIAVSEWLMEYFARKRDLHTCIRLARHFLTRVETESNEALLLEAYRMLWVVHADKGEWTETIRLCNKVVHLGPDTESLYSPAKFHESTFRYAGIDPGVSAWSMLATAYTKIGNLHQALQSIKRMSELAQELEHPLSLAVALSTQLSLQFEMKVLRSTEMVPIVEDFQAVHGFPRLSLVIQCSMAEQDAAIAREVYSSVIQQTKESLKEETWATNQRNIGPILRACQLAGEYGTGMALAVEIWMESEVAVGRFQSETWCAWMPETYLYLGQFKLMEAEEEQQPDMSIKERALWREEVWAEGLRYLAQSVVASRINGATFTELRALLILHRALEATKIKGALRPRKWVQELDPTILNAICVAERLQAVYDQLGGDSLTDWPDVNAAKRLLGRVKAQRKAAAIHQNRKSFFKQATHQALEEQRRKEEAGRLRKQRAQNMWRLGRASAVSETAEARRLEMEGECQQKCDIAEVRKAEHVRAVAALEDAEAECKISGWTFREKDKFGDFVAAFASLAAGQLTWLKAGDVDKPTGLANLNGCAARPVAKPRRKHPSAFEIALDPQVQVDSGSDGPIKLVIVPKDSADTGAWLSCVQKNSTYSIDTAPLQTAVEETNQLYVTARAQATRAKKVLKEHREASFAKAAFSAHRLETETAEKEESLPEPVPEVEVVSPDDQIPFARQIVVCGARGLVSADGTGSADAYAVVRWNEVEVGRTEIARRTLGPKWDTKFPLSVPHHGGSVRVELYDYDQAAAHHFLGQVEFQLSHTPGEEEHSLEFTTPQIEYPLKASSRNSGQLVKGSLTLRVEPEDEPEEEDIVIATLSVEVQAARGLPRMDAFSHTDAYAQLELEYTVYATKTIRDTESPVWGETFEFDIRHRDSVLAIRLFDHDSLDTDDPIGEVAIAIADIIESATIPRKGWFPITEVEGGPMGDLGALSLGLDLTKRGQPPVSAELANRRVSVTVVEADGLRAADGRRGKNDVYVVCTIPTTGATQRTSTIHEGGNAVRWGAGKGETVTFDVDAQERSVLEVTVMDEDIVGSDDQLGTGFVDIAELARGEKDWVELWQPLEPMGRLKMVLEWID